MYFLCHVSALPFVSLVSPLPKHLAAWLFPIFRFPLSFLIHLFLVLRQGVEVLLRLQIHQQSSHQSQPPFWPKSWRWKSSGSAGSTRRAAEAKSNALILPKGGGVTSGRLLNQAIVDERPKPKVNSTPPQIKVANFVIFFSKTFLMMDGHIKIAKNQFGRPKKQQRPSGFRFSSPGMVNVWLVDPGEGVIIGGGLYQRGVFQSSQQPSSAPG